MAKALCTKKNILIPEGTLFRTMTNCQMDTTYIANVELIPGVEICIAMDEEAFRALNLMNPQMVVF